MSERITKIKKLKHARKHGFLGRAATHTGKLVIKRRRFKGRARI